MQISLVNTKLRLLSNAIFQTSAIAGGSTFNNYSTALVGPSIVLQNGRQDTTICSQQRRYISESTYAFFLSPESFPIGSTQKLLTAVHDSTGLPWWASITLTTVALRSVLTLPLMVYSIKNKARIELLQPEIKQLSGELRAEVALAQAKYQWKAAHARVHFKVNMKRLVQKLYIRDNCHPLKDFVLPWIQIPMWISMSFALRTMAGSISVGGVDSPVLAPLLGSEGTLWFSNLLVCDSTFILPITVCIANLAIVEMHNLAVQSPTRFQTVITYTLRGLTLCMLPIAASLPSCIALYWSVSSVFGLAQNILLKLPRVRQVFKIPQTASHTDTPFIDLWTRAKQKYTFVKR